MGVFKLTYLSILPLILNACATAGGEVNNHRFSVVMQVMDTDFPKGSSTVSKDDVIARITYAPVSAAALSVDRNTRSEKLEKFVLYNSTFELKAHKGDMLYEILAQSVPGKKFCSVKQIGTYGGLPFVTCFIDSDEDRNFDFFAITHATSSSKNSPLWGGRLNLITPLGEPLAYEHSKNTVGLSSGDVLISFDGKRLEEDLDWDDDLARHSYYMSLRGLSDIKKGQHVTIGGVTLGLLDFEKGKKLTYEVIEAPKKGEQKRFMLDLITAVLG